MAFSRRGALALAGALVVIVVLALGSNVGGLREWLLGGAGAPGIDSIAVLPFENLSRDPAQEYFADGMTQMLIMGFQRVSTFRTMPAPVVMRYKKAPKPRPEIARELHVDAVVEGGVLRSGGRVEVRANLIRAETDEHLWTHTYERDLSEVLNLQAELLRDVARAIDARLTPGEEALISRSRPVNPQAHDALLRGLWGGNPAQTEALLNQTIQLDPTWSTAYDYLANRIHGRNMFPSFAPRDTFPKAKEAAQKAVSLDPTVPFSHRVLASVALEYDWDFAEAEKGFKRALEVFPNGAWTHHSYAHFLLSMGRVEEAAAESRRVIELSSMNSGHLACVSWHDITARNYDEAEKRAAQALSLGAPDQLARLTLGWSYLLRQRFDEAIPEFQKAVVGWREAVFPTAALGHAYAVAGREAEAREVLDKLLARPKTQYVSPYEIAVIHAGLGDREHAFEWLEQAYEDRASQLVYFRMDPRIWSLQTDARFQALLRRMNFPPAGQN